MIDGHHPKLDVMLRISLPDVDHIEIRRAITEPGMRRVIVGRGRTGDPRHMIVRIDMKLLVEKINVELPELPQVKADVLARVGYGSIRTNNYFV